MNNFSLDFTSFSFWYPLPRNSNNTQYLNDAQSSTTKFLHIKLYHFLQNLDVAVEEAIKSNDPAKLEKVLADADYPPLGYKNQYHGTLLHEAAELGSVEVTKYLIDAGLDIDRETDMGDGTPLLRACGNKNAETREQITRMLIEAGANVNAEAEGKSALHHHIEYNCLNSAKLLIEAGANINSRVRDAFLSLGVVFFRSFAFG